MSAALPDRRLSLLLPAAFLAALGIGIVNLGFLFVLKEAYGAGPALVGWFAACWAIAYFVGCIVLKPLSRILSAPASMAIMHFASAAFLIIHLLVPGIASAFICNSLYGFACALFWPRLMGWVTSGVEGPALGKANGAFSASWSVGSVIAPYIAGILTERGVLYPLYASIAVFLGTGIFILAARGIAPPPPRQPPAPLPGSLDRSSPLRFPSWVGVFLIYAFLAIFFNIFPVYAKDELAMSESGIGLVLLIRAAATAIGFYLVGRFSFWHFRIRLVPLAVLAALLIDLLFILIKSPLAFALGLFAAGLVQAIIYSMSLFYGASGAPDRDRRTTIHEALLTAGQIIGSIAGGLVYQLISWAWVFICLALLMAGGLGLQFAMLRRRAR
jgi:MFS family permease